MSTQPCLHCGEPVPAGRQECSHCGLPQGTGNRRVLVRSGLHPAAPIMFLLAAGAAFVAGNAFAGIPLAVPLALFGGGIGVWVLERFRRLL